MKKSILISIALFLTFSLGAQTAEDFYAMGNESLGKQKNHDAIAYYLKAIEIDNQNWTYYYNCGLAYYYISDYKNALFCFDQAYALESSYMDILSNRGNIKDALGDYEGALKDFEIVLAEQGPSWQLYNSMGIVYDNLKNFEKALEYFTLSIGLEEKQSAAYDNRAMVYRKMGNMEACCADLQLAIKYTTRGRRAQNHFDQYCK